MAGLAAAGAFRIPIARTFALDDVHAAAKLTAAGHPGGKLLLLVGDGDR